MAQDNNYSKFARIYSLFFTGRRLIGFIVLLVMLACVLILLILSIPITWIQIVLVGFFVFFYIIMFYGIFKALKSKKKREKN